MTRISLFLILLFLANPAMGQSRFFYHGDGKLKIVNKNKLQNLSPRLVALLDYLQKELSHGKGTIKILSGYRSPQYNENLRKQGRLAGKASLHLEGMAADFVMEGVPAKKIWEYVRGLNCCGVGYYHGDAIHLDTGPPRFWDETTSKVFTDISAHNKQIYAVTDYDIYHPGERVHFKLVRITEYPFGIKENGECKIIHDPEETSFTWPLPEMKKNSKTPLHFEIHFCDKPAKEMPDQITSNPFVIATPEQQ